MNRERWACLGGLVLMCWGSVLDVHAQPNFTRAAQPKPGAKVLAMVNGEPITRHDLDEALSQAGPTASPLTEKQRHQQQMEVLGFLIDERLMRQFLKRTTKPVTAAEVDKKIAELRAKLRSHEKSYAEFLKDIHSTQAQFRATVADRIRWARYAERQVTEERARKFFEEYRDHFAQVFVRASHIVMRVPKGAPASERARARNKLQKIRADILANKTTFAQAAKEYSQDPTGEKGGDLGFFPRLCPFLPDHFTRVAFSLQPKQMSDVIATDFGLHLIQVTDRKPGKPCEYGKIRSLVHQNCREDLLRKTLAHLHKTAKIQILIR